MSEDFLQILRAGDEVSIQTRVHNALNASNTIQSVKATVREVYSSHKLIIEIPANGGRFTSPSVGDRLEFKCLYEESGVMEFVGLIVNRIVNDDCFVLHVLRTSNIFRAQRREFFRVSLLQDAELFLENGEGEEIFIHNGQQIVQKVKQYKAISVILKDVSAGGARVFSKERLDVGCQLEVKFAIDHLKFRLNCEIVRCLSTEDVVKRFDLGIKFINMDTSLQTKLISIILEKQRKHLKKGLNS